MKKKIKFLFSYIYFKLFEKKELNLLIDILRTGDGALTPLGLKKLEELSEKENNLKKYNL